MRRWRFDLCKYYISHYFKIYCLKAGAGVIKVSDPGCHENTAEVCLVIKGKVRITIKDHSYKLEPNMAVRFKSLHEHWIDIVDDAKFLMIHHNFS